MSAPAVPTLLHIPLSFVHSTYPALYRIRRVEPHNFIFACLFHFQLLLCRLPITLYYEYNQSLLLRMMKDISLAIT